MKLPPSKVGACHVRTTFASPPTPTTEIGAPGTVRGVTLEGELTEPAPALLIALTRKSRATPLAKPFTNSDVTALPVLAFTVVHVTPLSSERSTTYPTIDEPPFETGADHVNHACASPGVAANPVGAPGREPKFGVPDAVAVAPNPTALRAATRTVTSVPFVSPPITAEATSEFELASIHVVPPSTEYSTEYSTRGMPPFDTGDDQVATT